MARTIEDDVDDYLNECSASLGTPKTKREKSNIGFNFTNKFRRVIDALDKKERHKVLKWYQSETFLPNSVRFALKLYVSGKISEETAISHLEDIEKNAITHLMHRGYDPTPAIKEQQEMAKLYHQGFSGIKAND